MVCLNTQKKNLKSCMLHWHLLHSNSLWGPVNQVPSLTRWNSRDANLANLPFLGPALKFQAPLSTPKSKGSSLQHTQPGLSSQRKCKAHRVQTRKPDCDRSHPETTSSTPEPKPSSAPHWHGTEPSEQRRDLKIENFWVQSPQPPPEIYHCLAMLAQGWVSSHSELWIRLSDALHLLSKIFPPHLHLPKIWCG